MEKYLNQAFELSKQIKSKVESQLDQVGGTEMEVKVKQATSMDNWVGFIEVFMSYVNHIRRL